MLMDTSGEGSCQVEEGAYQGPVERNRTGRREKACGPLMQTLLLGDNFEVLKENLLF